MDPKHTHRTKSRSCVVVDIKAPRTTIDAWFLLRSDAHHDNPKCNQDMERRHLDEAVARGAGVLDFGDLFCAMQGKFDKRSSKSALREEHLCGSYLDALVRTAADFYEPYAKHWVVIGRGNHETSIKKKHETDLTERLVATLNDRTGASIHCGGYTGWVRFAFDMGGTRKSIRLWWIHGYGGGGPVTADMIQLARLKARVANADIIAFGHTHDCWHREDVREWLNDADELEKRPFHGIKCPTYKDDNADGFEGWAVERGMPSKPLGAWWLHFTGSRRQGINIEFSRAN